MEIAKSLSPDSDKMIASASHAMRPTDFCIIYLSIHHLQATLDSELVEGTSSLTIAAPQICTPLYLSRTKFEY
jgi:hypothetical protein